MLQPPNNLEGLAPFHDEHYFQNQVQRLAALPPSLNQLGLLLINGRKRDALFDHEKQQRLFHQALEELAALPSPERQRLFKALAPSISGEIEAGWQVFDCLPYTQGFIRRPFRFTGTPRPVEANLARSTWVSRLMQAIKGYEQPVAWFAAWAAYLGWSAPDSLAPLFAGVMEQVGEQGQEIFDILIASAQGEHPIGKMGRHVVRALLCASRPDGWAFIERLLLAAQREEGLRQVILEAADEAHPEAFRRILCTVIDQNLVRFSAVVWAAGTWVGLPFEAASPKTVLEILGKLRASLDQSARGEAILVEGSPLEQYLGLWSIAYQDASRAVLAARPLLGHASVDHRFAAVYFLSQAQLAESEQALLPMLDDEDLNVAVSAYRGIIARGWFGNWYRESDLFERLERLVRRLPRRAKTFPPFTWEGMVIPLDPNGLPGLLVNFLGTRPPGRLLPYVKGMGSQARLSTAQLLQEHSDEDPRYRKALFDLAADRDTYVHERVFALLEKIEPRPEEIPPLEALFTRKTGSLRRAVIGLLLRQPDAGLLASIDRLLSHKDEQKHLAGVELLREMAQADRQRPECQMRIARLQSGGASDVEKNLLAGLFAGNALTYSLEDALGLADLNNLSRPLEPYPQKALFGLGKKVRLGSAAAAACIEALDELVDQHRTAPVEINDWRNEKRGELLGNVHGGLADPDPGLPVEENRRRFQLAEVWERWWMERPDSQRDKDGLELLRAQAALSLLTHRMSALGRWTQSIPQELRTYLHEPYDFHPRYGSVIPYVLTWLAYLHPAPQSAPFLLNAVEETFSQIGQNLPGGGTPSGGEQRWFIPANRLGYIGLAHRHRLLFPAEWTRPDRVRFWGLIRWLEQSAWQAGGLFRPELEDVLQAYQVGAAGEDDLFVYLLPVPAGVQQGGPHSFDGTYFLMMQPQYLLRQQFGALHLFSGKRPHPLFREFPFLQGIVDRCRERILEVELQRGDLPTAASAAAHALRGVPGAASMVRLLCALGNAGLERNALSQDRSSVLSHLLHVSYPLETDTAEAFATLVQGAHIPARRLVELAVYAPQWAPFVERTLGWPGMAEGVWWVYAHTRDRQWSVDADIREAWVAQIGEYTPLSADELLDGAVDVDWFQRLYAELGEERWQEIYRVALYAARGTGHTRARLFADALSGKIGAEELIRRIEDKRSQDGVRALGLVPLPEGAARQAEILRRYQAIQEFSRMSKQFGSQRQASEKLAASIGIANLARTAGYQDPQRLEWAMELDAVADLIAGPISVQADGISVTLAVDELGEAGLSVRRGDKILKNLPPDIKKDEGVAALVARRQTLEQQAGRMRASLEAAMVRGDTFHAAEIRALFAHPILRVMLEQLVFVGPAGMGYPVDGCQALEGLGLRFPLEPEAALRIAHPYDLLQDNRWHDWQHECFILERIQPFKQVFRELYVLTPTEQDEKDFSRRYAGQQVNPRQALALLGKRGWVVAPEDGVFKTFYAEGLVARLGFLQGFYTPVEVEGLTLEAVGFTRRGEGSAVPLGHIPPRLFSEVMRDLDLVASVAHAGGVDPEASASTVEARAILIQETCALLGFGNVRLENRHALIDGKLGSYTLHLGSGTVHKQPGGALCIIPVHSQHRGRLFLPFVDNDPKTAEVVSKVLLLAKDQDIKDPTILEQILR